MAAKRSPLDIVKVLRVVDTRDYVEGPGDTWVPVPGSGNIASCARCGRDHEVHAEVLLRNGTSVIVGTGCAMKDALELAPGIKSEESRAKTIRRWETRLALLREQLARYKRISQDVARLPLPKVYRERTPADDGWRYLIVETRERFALLPDWYTGTNREQERLAVGAESWRTKRAEEIFGGRPPTQADVEGAEDALRRALRPVKAQPGGR